MEPGFTLSDLFGIAGRRLWIVVLTVFLISPLALTVAYVLPPVYESSARILVESQQIPTDLARSTVTASAAERLQLIQQRLMTRENLLSVIERLNLFASRGDLTTSEKVELLRLNTVIRNINFGENRREQNVSAFVITYVADNANVAARVTNEFVALILEQNIQSRSERASETLGFFTQEVERLATQLLALEVELSNFKNANQNALPDSLAFRRQELLSLQERVFEYEQRMILLQEQRKSYEQARDSGAGATLTGQVLTPAERDLQELNRVLVQRKAILSDTHPEIVALKSRIAAIEASITPTVAGAPAGNPQIERQIALINTQITLVQGQIDEARSRIKVLDTSVAETPQVEMQLNALQRQYADLQTQYEMATSKQAEAATGEKLEINRQAERFEVIEQAQVPDAPISPNRMLIAAGGFVGSMALGIGMVVLVEMLDRTIRTPGDMQRRIGLKPIVTVPYIRTERERKVRLMKFALLVVTVLIVVPGALYAVDQYFMPLETLTNRIIDRLGLSQFFRLIETRFGL